MPALRRHIHEDLFKRIYYRVKRIFAICILYLLITVLYIFIPAASWLHGISAEIPLTPVPLKFQPLH